MYSLHKVVTRAYLLFAILVFTLTAFGKLTSNFSEQKLQSSDAFLSFIPAGQLLIMVAIVEIIVVCMLVVYFLRSPYKGIPLIIWLVSLFALYRIGFHFSPERAGACKCFGVGSMIGFMEAKADMISLILLTVLFFAGIALHFSRPNSTQARPRNRPMAPVQSIAVFLLTTLVAMTAGAQEVFTPLYSVEGLATEHLLNPAGDLSYTNTFPFKLTSDTNGNWQLIWKGYYPQFDLTSTEHISSNGKDIFSIIYADKRLDAAMKPVANLPLSEKEHPARACRGPFPTDYSSTVGLLWLAFFSGDYFVKSNTNYIPCLLAPRLRIDPEAWSCDVKFKLKQGISNHLLSSCEFIIDRARTSTDLQLYPEMDEPSTSEALQGFLNEVKRMQSARDDELLRASYSLEEVKAVGDIHLPVKFSALRYSPINSLPGHYIHAKLAVQITNIITGFSRMNLLPELLGSAVVEDRRFLKRTEKAYLNQIFYRMDSNGWVISREDKRFGTTYPVPIMQRPSLKVRRTGFYVTAVLFVLISFLPLWYFVRKNRPGGTQA